MRGFDIDSAKDLEFLTERRAEPNAELCPHTLEFLNEIEIRADDGPG